MFDSLRQLAVFAKIVECGSFKKAADCLNLSPSVVSYHVSQLEAELNTALLYRTTRNLSLTDDGKRVFTNARRMLEEAQKSISCLSHDNKELRGRLTLTFPSVLLKSPLFEKVGQFIKDNPRIKCELLVTDKALNMIDQGIDLAFRVGKANTNIASLKQRKVGQVKRVLVAHKDLLSTYGKPETPEQLSEWPWIGLTMLPYSRSLSNESGRLLKIDYHPRITVDGVEAMTELVKQGLGIATPPDYLVDREIYKQTLIELFPSHTIPSLDVMALWPIQARQNNLSHQLIQYVSRPH